MMLTDINIRLCKNGAESGVQRMSLPLLRMSPPMQRMNLLTVPTPQGLHAHALVPVPVERRHAFKPRKMQKLGKSTTSLRMSTRF
jgi:hypothetical protein